MSTHSPSHPELMFPGDGEMARQMQVFDWASTPVGPPAGWPESLRSAIRLILSSRYPMFIWWGREHLTHFYNDAYAPVLGTKHPAALGQSGARVWAEIWDVIGPMTEGVFDGRAHWSEEFPLILERHGYREETYFTFSYSPILEPAGTVGGFFCTCMEETRRVLAERRLKTQRALAEISGAQSIEEACAEAARALAGNLHDFPFALIYLLDTDAGVATLAPEGATCEPQVALRRIELGGPDDVWTLGTVLRAGRPRVVEAFERAFVDAVPARPWGEAPTRALVAPLPRPGGSLAGFAVFGISPRQLFDAEYLGFGELVARHIATGIGSARAYADERRRAESLAELDRAKTAFFSNVSHEFRTPLTLLLGPLEDVLASNGLAPEQRTGLDVAHRNSVRLLKLVNTLLDFSRIEAGRVEATFEQTDVAAYTAELASVFRSAVERAGLSLDVRCAPIAALAFVDREMWEKIVLNLLSNAFKYTLEGRITVATAERDGWVELVVQDTGTGIPAAELPHVFERFHRVRGSQGRTHEGTGIGLALVSELVKLHGGTVGARSEVGRGSTFTVRIPAGSAHLPPDRIGATRALASTALGAGPYIEEALRWLPDVLPAPQAASRLESLTMVTTRGARVLVADDNADMRDYIVRLLRQYWDVEAVADGAAGLEAIRAHRPDLVLSDVMMPRLDGMGLLRAIRDDPALRALPVILLSARAGEESRVEGWDVGADDYLVKPFAARELLARVNAHLEMARVRREAVAEREREETRYRSLVEATTSIVWHADASGDVTYGPRLGEFTGLSKAEFVGSGWLAAIHPEDRDGALAVWESARRDGMPAAAEHRMRRRDGVYRSVVVQAVPMRSGAGEIEEWVGTITDITDRRQAEARLEQTIGALREADERKDEFLAMLAHELRNPLAATQNATRLLALLGVDEPRFLQARTIIERQTGHLVRLVDDLLDVSRITRGKISLHREPLSLHAVVSAAVELARPAVDRLSHVLTISHAQENVRLEGDFARLVQVVSNLLTNAAKFTPAGGRITITTQQTADRATIRVRDSGVGISRELQGSVFDLFVQGDGGLARTQGGLGIGLTLAKRIVELHQGTIEVRSEGVGRGSEFIVTLPALPASAQLARPQAPRLTGGSRPLRIMLVEDNPDAAESFTLLLELGGHEVRAADEAREALRLVEDFVPDLAFVDVGLPGIDGYELATRLRAHPSCQSSVLVALTGYGRDEDKRRASEAGFDHHMTKPVDFEAVDHLLANVSAPAGGVIEERGGVQ